MVFKPFVLNFKIYLPFYISSSTDKLHFSICLKKKSQIDICFLKEYLRNIKYRIYHRLWWRNQIYFIRNYMNLKENLVASLYASKLRKVNHTFFFDPAAYLMKWSLSLSLYYFVSQLFVFRTVIRVTQIDAQPFVNRMMLHTSVKLTSTVKRLFVTKMHFWQTKDFF